MAVRSRSRHETERSPRYGETTMRPHTEAPDEGTARPPDELDDAAEHARPATPWRELLLEREHAADRYRAAKRRLLDKR